MVLPPFLGQIADATDVAPLTAVVWLLGLLASVGSLAIVTAVIVGRFVRVLLRGGHVSTKTRQTGHVVICGWNGQGQAIVDALMVSDCSGGIVVVANLERRPLDNDDVEFISGDPTQDDSLKRAGIENARSAIVLTDFHESANDADAKALLIALAVESMNASVHTCVQILNSANARHFERAGVDEMICLDQIGGNLAVAAAVNPGVSALVSELLTFNFGSEFYRVEGSPVISLVGKSYVEVVKTLAEKHVIVLGVETETSVELCEAMRDEVIHRASAGGRRMMMVNPRTEYRMQKGDTLFCAARSRTDVGC
jgi:voltage-gated potassium channel